MWLLPLTVISVEGIGNAQYAKLHDLKSINYKKNLNAYLSRYFLFFANNSIANIRWFLIKCSNSRRKQNWIDFRTKCVQANFLVLLFEGIITWTEIFTVVAINIPLITAQVLNAKQTNWSVSRCRTESTSIPSINIRTFKTFCETHRPQFSMEFRIKTIKYYVYD